jgi:catechol 2,3-dioxygenase-like lactoylglutathione lyase family enzyme
MTMAKARAFRVLFVAGFGPIVADGAASRGFYRDALGLPFEEQDGYLHTGALEGAKAFALWPLAQAARSCFGQEEWPADLPVPQAWLEFDVDDVAAATKDLVARGYRPIVSNRAEPWGQTVTRLLGPEGLLVGVTFTPWLRPPPPKRDKRVKRVARSG